MAWNYSAPNLGLLFYKQIYKERDLLNLLRLEEDTLKFDIPDTKITAFDKFYNALVNFKTDDYNQIDNPAATNCFCLRTAYPGLLIGSGYTHDTGAKGDFKIGFFFDHTSGQPIIPGSSVKGVLRSIFELDSNSDGTKYTGEKSVVAVNSILKEVDQDYQSLTTENVNQLKQELFGNLDQQGCDIFFDAVIEIRQTGSKKILSTDFITPHKHTGTPRRPALDQFSNPTPLMFLRVMPEICFEFRFKLAASDILGIDLKTKFFMEIIKTLGIGAKTNVGYGQFEAIS